VPRTYASAYRAIGLIGLLSLLSGTGCQVSSLPNPSDQAVCSSKLSIPQSLQAASKAHDKSLQRYGRAGLAALASGSMQDAQRAEVSIGQRCEALHLEPPGSSQR
jgi:hypothetical protein